MFKFLKRLKNTGFVCGFGHRPKSLTQEQAENMTKIISNIINPPIKKEVEPPTNIIPFPKVSKKSPQRLLKHRKALIELYREHGVGRTVNQRLNFWRKKNETYPVFSTIPTIKGEVAFLEEEWLTANFPADFNYY